MAEFVHGQMPPYLIANKNDVGHGWAFLLFSYFRPTEHPLHNINSLDYFKSNPDL